MKPLIFISSLLLFFSGAMAQESIRAIESGNQFYRSAEFSRAVGEYSRALELEPGNITARYNLANATYRQDQKVEAVQQFTALARESKDEKIRAAAYYNKGVILSQQKNLEESIEAYKQAIRINPADQEARENLQKALLELKKKTPPPKKDNNQNKKKQDPKQQQQPQSKMSPKETEQRLKLLEQKEKEVQQRLQREKSKSGGSQPKDW